jgi:hypothetical protein
MPFVNRGLHIRPKEIMLSTSDWSPLLSKS